MEMYMNKYCQLWEYIQKDGQQTIKLAFDEIEAVSGAMIDHSFLNYKKELTLYGYEVEKISMKEYTVIFTKIEK